MFNHIVDYYDNLALAYAIHGAFIRSYMATLKSAHYTWISLAEVMECKIINLAEERAKRVV